MSISTAALKSARVYLNDINALTWTDSILMPFLQEAHGEMIQDLDLNSVGVLKYETSPITIPIGQLNMGANQPTNILEPIAMLERQPGADQESFVDMYQVAFLPHVDQTQYLTWWCWNAETIQFVGATTTREVVLRYKGSLVTPQLLTDPIGVIYGERYLGPRIAALAYYSIDKDATKLDTIAQAALYKLLQRGVLARQYPTRRRAYRSPKSTLGITGPVATTVSVAQGPNSFAATTTPATGQTGPFVFLHQPIGIFINGLLQPVTSYSVAPSGSIWNVTFTSAPPNGATIIEMYNA